MNELHDPSQTAIDDITTELRRASDFQATLLGMAGHDLRQPLQVLQSTYEWLGARVAHSSDIAQLARGERAIARLTQHLDQLIGALRLYESSQRIELSPVQLTSLLWRIASENEDAARAKSITMRVHPTRVAVLSNPVLLEGIIRNLVRNAVKFTGQNGCILIGCRRMRGDVRIDVCDSGIGIQPEHLHHIFEAFKRGESRADGLGIGLFVVRRAAELLEHRVEVRSQVGRGSRFSVFARLAQ